MTDAPKVFVIPTMGNGRVLQAFLLAPAEPFPAQHAPGDSMTPYWLADQNKDGVRANVWGPKGYSTKTCNTTSEARSFINACKARNSK